PADGNTMKGKIITYHDPCDLGRGNNVYEAPRKALEVLDADLIEMKRCRSNGLCCGARGAQMFKEPEKGKKDINEERMEDIIETKAEYVASACPIVILCSTAAENGKMKNRKLKF